MRFSEEVNRKTAAFVEDVVAAVIDDCLESVALALEAGVRDQDMRTAVLDTVKDYLSREWF
jgi:hypothetical protein